MSFWNSYIFWSGDEVPAALASVVTRQNSRVLLIGGEGFDPRMPDCANLLKKTTGVVSVDVKLLQIGRPASSEFIDLNALARSNLATLEELAGSNFELIDATFDEEDRNSTAPQASDKALDFARECGIKDYDSVIVDISALPQGLYFPILQVLISHRRAEFRESKVSLYAFVSESVEVDQRITALELQEDAYWVPPFRSALTGTDDTSPVVWFPVLGKGEREQLERIERLLPRNVEREVCPVLPMPSANPRRGDDLVREYAAMLQDSWSVDARSIIYSAERNPFHLYAQLTTAALRYKDALKVLGGCRGVISSHSSKLLSLGAILAASELSETDFEVGLANVDASRYQMDDGSDESFERTYFLVPLLGEVYDE